MEKVIENTDSLSQLVAPKRGINLAEYKIGNVDLGGDPEAPTIEPETQPDTVPDVPETEPTAPPVEPATVPGPGHHPCPLPDESECPMP